MANDLRIFTRGFNRFGGNDRAIEGAKAITVHKTRNGDAWLKFELLRPASSAGQQDVAQGFYVLCTDTAGYKVFEGFITSITPENDVQSDEPEKMLVEAVGTPARIAQYGPIADKGYTNTTPESVLTDLLGPLSPSIKLGSLVSTGITGIDYNAPQQYPSPDLIKAVEALCSMGTSTGLSVYWRIKDRKFYTYAVDYANPTSAYFVTTAACQGINLRLSLDEVYTEVVCYYKDASGLTQSAVATDTSAPAKYGVTLPGEIAVSNLVKRFAANLSQGNTAMTPAQAQYIATALLNKVSKLSHKSNNITITGMNAITSNSSQGAIALYMLECGNFLEITDLNSQDSAYFDVAVNNRIFVSEWEYSDETGVLSVVPEQEGSLSEFIAKLQKSLPNITDAEKRTSLPDTSVAKNGQSVFMLGDGGAASGRQYDYNKSINKWVSRQEFRAGASGVRGLNPALGQIIEFVDTCEDCDGFYIEQITGTFITTAAQNASNWFTVNGQGWYGNGLGAATQAWVGPVSILRGNSGGDYVADTKTLAGIGGEFPFKLPLGKVMPKSYMRLVVLQANINGTPGGIYLYPNFKYRLIKYPNGLNDSFNRTASASDPGSADSTHLWIAAPSTALAGITADGKLYFSSTGAQEYVWTRLSNTKNFTGSVKMKPLYNTVSNFELLNLGIRGTAANNLIYIQLLNGNLTINKLVSGSAAQLAISTATMASGTEHTLTFSANENVISATLGSTTVTATLAGGDSTMFNAANCDYVVGLHLRGGSPPAGNATMDDLNIIPI